MAAFTTPQLYRFDHSSSPYVRMVAVAEIEKGTVIHANLLQCPLHLSAPIHGRPSPDDMALLPPNVRPHLHVQYRSSPGQQQTVQFLYVPTLHWMRHSCAPNAGISRIKTMGQRDELSLIAWTTIPAGREITRNYAEPSVSSSWPSAADRHAYLRSVFDIDSCKCKMCDWDILHSNLQSRLAAAKSELDNIPRFDQTFARVEKAQDYSALVEQFCASGYALGHPEGGFLDPRLAGAYMYVARACSFFGYGAQAGRWEGKAREVCEALRVPLIKEAETGRV